MPNGKTDKNMVPKQKNEAEEGNTSDQGTERTGKTGASAKSGGGGGRSRPS